MALRAFCYYRDGIISNSSALTTITSISFHLTPPGSGVSFLLATTMGTYTPEQKAAVMAALLTGQSVSQCAEEYKIPRGTVAKWSAKLDRSGGLKETGETEETGGNTKSRARIGELLLGYVEANLETLTAQQVVFKDEDWLRKQPASELAVLHGVLADKTIRLLEAMSTDGEDAAN